MTGIFLHFSMRLSVLLSIVSAMIIAAILGWYALSGMNLSALPASHPNADLPLADATEPEAPLLQDIVHSSSSSEPPRQMYRQPTTASEANTSVSASVRSSADTGIQGGVMVDGNIVTSSSVSSIGALMDPSGVPKNTMERSESKQMQIDTPTSEGVYSY
mgnify:CR=1 FL=1